MINQPLFLCIILFYISCGGESKWLSTPPPDGCFISYKQKAELEHSLRKWNSKTDKYKENNVKERVVTHCITYQLGDYTEAKNNLKKELESTDDMATKEVVEYALSLIYLLEGNLQDIDYYIKSVASGYHTNREWVLLLYYIENYRTLTVEQRLEEDEDFANNIGELKKSMSDMGIKTFTSKESSDGDDERGDRDEEKTNASKIPIPIEQIIEMAGINNKLVNQYRNCKNYNRDCPLAGTLERSQDEQIMARLTILKEDITKQQELLFSVARGYLLHLVKTQSYFNNVTNDEAAEIVGK